MSHNIGDVFEEDGVTYEVVDAQEVIHADGVVKRVETLIMVSPDGEKEDN